MLTKSRILIVDDEPFNVDYLEQELDGLEYELFSAANGAEALQKIQSEKPDLVLLDIMMPIMDGFSVLEKAKADPATRTIPIIIISANSDLKSIVKGIKMGAEDYLPKPFEPTILHARIAASLERKHLRDLEQMHTQSLEREMNTARDIQREFLPPELPAFPGWEVAAYFKAANIVAGDYYDAFPLPDGNLALVVGDVCGKGVGAALFMTLFRSLIRATSSAGLLGAEIESNTRRIEQAVSITNQYIAITHEQALVFSTLFIGALNVKDGTLTYINAGNEAPLLLRSNGSVEQLKPTGPVVGYLADAVFKVGETHLEPSDSLIAFTDGIPDSKNQQDEFYGHERLNKILKQRGMSSTELVNHLGDELLQFIGEADQFDDITILAVRRLPQL